MDHRRELGTDQQAIINEETETGRSALSGSKRKRLRPVETSKMPPSSNTAYTNNKSTPTRIGLDTLYLLIDGEFTEESKGVLAELALVKEQAYESGEDREYRRSEIGYQVKPHRAGRYGNSFFHFQLVRRGITLHLSGNPEQSEKCAIAKVEIGSLALMQRGPRYMWEQAQEAIENLGYRITGDRVTRCDVCCDVPVSMEEVERAIDDGRYVIGSMKKPNRYGMNPLETVYFGKRGDGIVLRIYDKFLELFDFKPDLDEWSKRKKGWKKDSDDKHTEILKGLGLSETGGNVGVNCGELMRVEFEIKRSFLKRSFTNVSSFEEVMTALPSIWAHLTEKYFRLTTTPRKRTNTNLLKVLPLWKIIQQAGEQLGSQVVLKKVKRVPTDPMFSQGEPYFMKRAMDALEGAMACRLDQIEDRQDREEIEEAQWELLVRYRRTLEQTCDGIRDERRHRVKRGLDVAGELKEIPF